MSSPEPVPARSWLEWSLLAATAAPLILVAYTAYRDVFGPLPAFLSQGEQVVGLYTRLAYFQQSADLIRVLVLPLLGVAALCWLLRPSAQLTDRGPLRLGALVLTALLALESAAFGGLSCYLLVAPEPSQGDTGVFFGFQKLETLAPTVVGALLVLVLAGVLARVLLTSGAAPVKEGPAQQLDEPDTGPAPVEVYEDLPAEDPAALHFGRPETVPTPVDADPHAAYRRPNA